MRVGEVHDFAFDYVLLDESQDFPIEFIELCSMVTKNTVYVAGDIFQSIFDENIVSEVSPDFLLSKCYRTDPRTLMFAHAVGMGLFESEKLRWLDDDQWEKCGYQIEKSANNRLYSLSREPLRRFEDLAEDNFVSMEIIPTDSDASSAAMSVISVIEGIIKENDTVTGADIGIVFSGSKRYGFDLGDILESQIPQKFGWELNKAYESKSSSMDNTIFYSNKNNVKGLEFPFLICIANYISNAKHERNALYMLLTRSFLKSYLITDRNADIEKFKLIENGLNFINTNNYMEVVAPTVLEQQHIRTNIEYSAGGHSVHEITEAVFDELDVAPIVRDVLRGVIGAMDPETLDFDSVKELVSMNVERLGFNK
jgi:superfamily I DNA and RNA helicase